MTRVKTRTLRKTLAVPASIEADAMAPIVPQVEANVREVLVDIGDRVRKGQVLVELDAPPLLEQVNRRQSGVEQREADVRLAEAEVAAARSRLSAQLAKRDLRASELRRVEELVGQGQLAQQRLDESAYAAAAAAAEIVSLESDVAVAEARVDRANTDVTVAVAELGEAKAVASFLTVRSPLEGVVTHRSVDPGYYVKPAVGRDAAPMVTVADMSKLRAVVYLTVEDAAMAAVGANATLAINDVPGEVFAGQLARASGVFDAETRMMRAEIDIANPETSTGVRRLRAGGYGVARIVTAEESLPSAPRSAVVRSSDGDYVVRVGPGGALRKAFVSIAFEADDYLGFSGGVRVGDRIVAANAAELQIEERIAGRIRELDE